MPSPELTHAALSAYYAAIGAPPQAPLPAPSPAAPPAPAAAAPPAPAAAPAAVAGQRRNAVLEALRRPLAGSAGVPGAALCPCPGALHACELRHLAGAAEQCARPGSNLVVMRSWCVVCACLHGRGQCRGRQGTYQSCLSTMDLDRTHAGAAPRAGWQRGSRRCGRGWRPARI